MERRYCSHCGREIAQSMNFCPRCGASLEPTPVSAVQSTPSRLAPVPLLAAQAVLYGFFGSLWCFADTINNHLLVLQVIVLFTAGSVAGFLVMYALTLRQLRVIDVKGVVLYPMRRTIIILILTITILLVGGFLALRFLPPNSEALDLFLVFICPLPTSAFAARALLYRKWEKETKKQLLWEKGRLLSLPLYLNR